MHEAHEKMNGMHEGRRYHEMKAAGMISENHNAVANMPQEVRYVAWPSYEVGLDAGMDDTIRGINEQMNQDLAGGRRHLKPTKY